MIQPKIVRLLKTHMLTVLTVLAVILSVVVGIALRVSYPRFDQRTVMYVGFLGDLFLRMIRAIILPLIVSSLIAAIAPLDITLSKKIGIRAITYILLTTITAVIIGIILVVIIQPGGKGLEDNKEAGTATRKASTIVDTLLDLIR